MKRENMQKDLDDEGEGGEVVLPGRHPIPEFVAWEFVILTSKLEKNPSEIAQDVKDTLCYE